MGLVQADTWSWPRKLLFRFLCAYFVLYILPFPLKELAMAEMSLRSRNQQPPAKIEFVLAPITDKYDELWDTAVKWAGDHILNLSYPITIRPNGSGDTTWNCVQVLCFAILAAGVALIWSAVDWRTTNYSGFREALRIYVRFYVAAQMILYGAIKVIPSQFPPPALDRLVQPFGDASPMGLLWTFMGASAPYTSFTGAAELLGGMLLTTRRTMLFGALVSAGVLAHIVALNFCYDVPVKLFSLHLLVMALWLIGPDIRRLVDWFVLHRDTEPAAIGRLVRPTSVNATLVVVRTLLVGGYVALWLHSALEGRERFAGSKPNSPLNGVWTVEEFVVDGKEHPPLVTDRDRWRRFIVDYPGMAGVQLTNASRVRYRMQVDPTTNAVTLRRPDFSDWKADFTYSRPDDDHLVLEGKLDGHDLHAKLQKEDAPEFLSQFRLTTRGFHWINEYPFNR